MNRLERLLAWAKAHKHALLVWAGLAAEGAAHLGETYGGPSWLALGHLLFIGLVGAGIISTSAKARVVALEAAVDALAPKTPLGSVTPDGDPYTDVPTSPSATSSADDTKPDTKPPAAT